MYCRVPMKNSATTRRIRWLLGWHLCPQACSRFSRGIISRPYWLVRLHPREESGGYAKKNSRCTDKGTHYNPRFPGCVACRNKPRGALARAESARASSSVPVVDLLYCLDTWNWQLNQNHLQIHQRGNHQGHRQMDQHLHHLDLHRYFPKMDQYPHHTSIVLIIGQSRIYVYYIWLIYNCTG